MGENIRTPEVLSSVKWYFELKNLSLKNALSLRCPLSVENQKDLRQYYSQYFAGLLSATELLLEKGYPNRTKFKEALEAKLIFDGYFLMGILMEKKLFLPSRTSEQHNTQRSGY